MRGIARPRALARAAAALALVAAFAAAVPARAAIQTDPAALYATMKSAYDKGAAHGWTFESQVYYESTVFDAGRSYALFRPDDPQNAEIALLAVDVATILNYDPLTNNDAALWYVLEAANEVGKNGDAQHRAEANALLARLQPLDGDPKALAAAAVRDARANVAAFANDGDARVQAIVADVRAYALTHDVDYRSDLLQMAANPQTPLERVPDPEFGVMMALAKSALTDPGYTQDDRAAAAVVADRRAHDPVLREIARVYSIPHDLRMTRIAPADEYFGALKYSPIGVRNEVTRINKYLDKGWGDRMESQALNVDSAVEDWQKQYPHDETLPGALLDVYQLMARMDSPKAQEAAARLKSILLVQYPRTRQSQELSS